MDGVRDEQRQVFVEIAAHHLEMRVSRFKLKHL
jgi:hypothetical protein